MFAVVVFSFQPLELVSLHQNLKQDGISCGLGKLVDFLDEQVIVGTAYIVACVLISYYELFFSFCEQFEKCDKLWHEYRDRDVVYLIKLKDSYLTNLISLGSSSTHEILQKLHKILILGRNKVTQKVTKLLNFHKL